MQVRVMKAVEAVRHRPLGGEPGLGIWLGLESLAELPLTAPAQLELWRSLLTALGSGGDSDQDDCRAALLALLTEWEPLQGCQSLEQGAWQEGRRAWQEALEHHHQLLVLRPALAAAATARLLEGLIQMLARLDQALTHRLWRPPVTPLENAQVHGLASDLLLQIHALGRPLPSWFAVVEEGLLRRGALALLQQVDGDSRRQAITLLLRLARTAPVPEWLPAHLELAILSLLADLEQSSQPLVDLQALLEALQGLAALLPDPERRAPVEDALALAEGSLMLAAGDRLRTAAASEAWHGQVQPLEPRGAAVAPGEITALVNDWLEDHPASEASVELTLVWIPGARLLPHAPGQLALNLAAVVVEGHSASQTLEPVLAAFFAPLLQARRAEGWQLRQAAASLLTSLGHLWSSGGLLTAADCRVLAAAQGLWQRWAGHDDLAARQLPLGWPPASLEPGCCLVQPSAVQLAALRCWLLEREQLERGLGLMRRHHHDPGFMGQGGASQDPDGGDAVQALCALHVEEGFYAATAAPAASLRAWAERSLALLAHAQLLLDPQQPLGSWWAVLQGLMLERNRPAEVVAWPDEERFHGLLAGQEVVLVSPLAAVVEEQHRNGRAFDLYVDRAIAPYGLRCVQAPASRYPGRPHQGFEASLAACLAVVDGLARQRPFSVFLTAAGAYDLPLCEAVRSRHGASCVAMGPVIHGAFGIELPPGQHWRQGQRRSDRWLRIS